MKTPAEILAEYDDKVTRLRAIGSQHKEIQPLLMPDLLYIKAVLHPTAKKSSRDITRRLVEYLCNAEICTARDIYESLDCADKPVLQRLRKFKEMGLVRRESKRFYIRTPRLLQLKDQYLERVCGE